MKTKIALVYDDGFRRSCEKIASIYTEHGLSATFAILAEPSTEFHSTFPDAPRDLFGDWDFFNRLQREGHHIFPHGLGHENLSQLSHQEALAKTERCLQLFQENLEGFNLSNTVYCYAYNASTPKLNEWLLERVRALRHAGTGWMTAEETAGRVWHCRSIGPGYCDEDVIASIKKARDEGWGSFIYNLHGVDGEGWGPVYSETLHRVLEMLEKDPKLEYWDLGSDPS